MPYYSDKKTIPENSRSFITNLFIFMFKFCKWKNNQKISLNSDKHSSWYKLQSNTLHNLSKMQYKY